MFIGDNQTSEAIRIWSSIIKKFLNCLIIEHFIFFLELIDLYVRLYRCITAIAFIKHIRLPFSKIMLGCG